MAPLLVDVVTMVTPAVAMMMAAATGAVVTLVAQSLAAATGAVVVTVSKIMAAAAGVYGGGIGDDTGKHGVYKNTLLNGFELATFV